MSRGGGKSGGNRNRKYRAIGPSPTQLKFIEGLSSLPQELLNTVFRYIFLNDYSPSIVYKLGLLRECKDVRIVTALKESIDMNTMIRVGRRNRSRELISQHWCSLGRLENIAITVPDSKAPVVNPDDVKAEFQKLISNINVHSLRSLYFTTWSRLDKDNYATLSHFMLSAPSLRNLLLPATSYKHTRGVKINTCLKYDDGTQLWTRINADLEIAKIFLQREGLRKLNSITLVGQTDPKVNVAQTEDIRRFFELTESASHETPVQIQELFAIGVDLAEVTKFVSLSHLKHLFTWDSDNVFEAFSGCESASLLIERLNWVHTRTAIRMSQRNEEEVLAFFAKLIHLRRLRIHHRSQLYMWYFREHLHEYLTRELESASMTSGDTYHPKFHTRQPEEIWGFQYKGLKDINLALGGVHKPFQGRDAAENAHFKSVIERYVKRVSHCKKLEIFALSGSQDTIQEKKCSSGPVVRAYREVAQQAANALKEVGLNPSIISMHGKEPVLKALKTADITLSESERLFNLGLSSTHNFHSYLDKQAPMMPSWKKTLKEHWAMQWLAEYAGT
ncbi:uncharacterized protein J4E78_006917 [Alternaria triticimaculans]|uniref:uncharacterized protein n=1 Tax=Alternaria triticimaculans TaxID=297637 RepID=UPI0020C47A42|nr:uncharacterized protein J4E78_006917 [Alternaria triticimaculans]KAI4654740.1 hypothetical protein J4E78_006917 [Alternaria triticimaculans]